MPEPYDITYLGNPILRMTAQKIEYPTSKEMQDIIDRMTVTVEQKLGGKDRVAGLAAPQFGKSIQMFIFQSSGPRAGEEVIPFTIIINPEILEYSDEKEKDYEGCFSLPLLIAQEIPRSKSIKCKYTTVDGEVVSRDLNGFAARVFQHEFDHLNGILAIDHTNQIIFSDSGQTMKEVLGITTGKELSEQFIFNSETGQYERKELTPSLTKTNHI